MADQGAPEPAELAFHPGRPRGRDEIDPELIRLPRPRARVGWLLALSVVVLCAYFMIRLRSDLAFSRQPDDPERLADLDALAAAEPNTYVEIEAVPDRAFLLWVYASEASDGHRLAPLLGSGDRAWLMLSGSHYTAERAHDEVYRGRVRRLGDLPFHQDLIERLSAMAVPRGISAEALRRRLAEGRGPLLDVAGDRLDVGPDTPVIITERVAGRAALTALRSAERGDERAWRAALEAAGILPPGAPLAASSEDSWTFEVDAPEGVDALNARLVEARLLSARAAPLDRVHRVPLGELSAAGDHLEAGGAEPAAIPWRDIISLMVEVPRTAPADARVLVATEQPGDYWYVLPLYALFGGFALLFLWALWRTVRADRADGAAAAEAEAEAAQPGGPGAAETGSPG